jgi:hypothetical protein
MSHLGIQEITGKAAALPADYIARLPSFCVPIQDEGDPTLAIWIDFWAVKPFGDEPIDRLRGEAYAHEAIWYAHQRAQPEFLELVVIWMMYGLFDEGVGPGPLEQGFLDQIQRDEPSVFDRIVISLGRLYPQLRN